MHDTIRSLWLGEVRPGERSVRKDSEYHHLVYLLSDLTERLRSRLNDDEKELLEKILDLENEMQSISDEELFIDAFQLGVRLAVEALTDYPGQFSS